VGDAPMVPQELALGLVDAKPRDELVRRFVERLREEAVEVERREPRLARRVLERLLRRETVRQEIARAAQPRERRRIEEADAPRVRRITGPETRSHRADYCL